MSTFPEPPLSQSYGLVVRSVGRAGAAERHALASVLGIPLEALTAALLRAPTLISETQDAEAAKRVLALLHAAGVEAELLGSPEAFAPGRGDLDVAVRCADAARLPEVIARLSSFLGHAPTLTATQLLREPPLVLGRVSAATTEAIARLLDGCGARVIGVDPAQSRFDARVRSDREPEQILADLDAAQAERLWSEATRSGAQVDIVHTAMHVWDVVLERARPTPALTEALIALGIPARVAPRLPERVPVVLTQGADGDTAAAQVATLRAIGAEAQARCVTFARYGLRIDEVTNPDTAAAILAGLGGLAADQVRPQLERAPVTLDGPFGDLRARWLVHELRSIGCRVQRIQVGQA